MSTEMSGSHSGNINQEQQFDTSTINDILMAGDKSKGGRPYFFNDQAVERVLNITMAVATELAVARERIDTLERLLEAKESLEVELSDEEAKSWMLIGLISAFTLGLGTFAGNLIFIYGGRLIADKINNNQHVLNWVIGSIFAITALIQIWRMVKKKDVAHKMEHPEEMTEKIEGQMEKIEEGLDKISNKDEKD